VISDDEMAYLSELRRVLTLSASEADGAVEQAVSARYERSLKEVLADGTVTPEERACLDRIAKDLRLGDQTRATLNKINVNQYAQSQAKVIAADQRASTDELQALDDIGAALGVDIKLDKATSKTLTRYRWLWLIENGQPPAIPVDISLQKGEEAYFTTLARWAELRTKTVRINYSGVTASIRIVKGLRWRVGTIVPQRITQEQLTVLNSGILYITNKRVILRGKNKNMAVRLDALLGIRVFSDGIQLDKATGRSPVVLIDGDIETAAVLLTSLLADSSTETQ
jgi:hypothetical protein